MAHKSGACLVDYMSNPAECKSIDRAHTPFQMAFKPEGDFFEWCREPRNTALA